MMNERKNQLHTAERPPGVAQIEAHLGPQPARRPETARAMALTAQLARTDRAELPPDTQPEVAPALAAELVAAAQQPEQIGIAHGVTRRRQRIRRLTQKGAAPVEAPVGRREGEL